MQHCSPDDLSLLALGEPVDVDHAHLRSCPDCSAELEALRSVVTSARSGQVDEVAPPPAVWAGIVAATGVGGATATETRPVPSQTRLQTPESPDRAVAARRPSPPTRRWPSWALAAATVAGLLAGGGVVAALDGTDSPAAEQVVAAELEPLVPAAQAGSASLVETDGQLVLRLTAGSLPSDPGAFHEVWLLDEEAQRMVALGVLVGSEGDFVVPSGLDVEEFPVVDVSVQLYNGDPTHSGNSVLRGTLSG